MPRPKSLLALRDPQCQKTATDPYEPSSIIKQFYPRKNLETPAIVASSPILRPVTHRWRRPGIRVKFLPSAVEKSWLYFPSSGSFAFIFPWSNASIHVATAFARWPTPLPAGIFRHAVPPDRPAFDRPIPAALGTRFQAADQLPTLVDKLVHSVSDQDSINRLALLENALQVAAAPYLRRRANSA